MDGCKNSRKLDSTADLGVKVAERDIELTTEESSTSNSNLLRSEDEPRVSASFAASIVTPECAAMPVGQALASRAPEYFAGASLSDDRKVNWPKTRRRQFLNLAYFGVCGLLINTLSSLFDGPYLSIGASLCFALAAASGFYLARHRTHLSCDDELPIWAQRSLRATAFVFPALIIGGGLWLLPSQISQTPLPSPPLVASQNSQLAAELKLADKLYGERDYGGAATHYNNVVRIDSKNEHSYERLADCYLRSPNYDDDKSIENADQALNLNADNVPAASSKAWALNNMKRYSEALVIATAAAEKNSSYGEAFACIAEAQRGLHNYAAALKADNEHVRLHYWESQSYKDRAETLKALGRNAEAKADLARAKKAGRHHD